MRVRRAPAFLLALQSLVVLVGGSWAVWPHGDADRRAAGKVLAAQIPQLEAFVAKTRHLSFRRHVTVEVITQDQLEDKLGGGPGPSTSILSYVLYTAGTTTALKHFEDLAGKDSGHIVGLYDNNGHLFVVGDGADNPYTRSVLVHELTHALDDQYFHLAGLHERRTSQFDRRDAELALMEGDAERVRNAYVAQLSPTDKAAYDAARKKLDDADDPIARADALLLNAEFGYPYRTGALFAARLAKAGTLNAAFRSKAFSTQDVDLGTGRLPTAYPVMVNPPDPGLKNEIDGTFGVHQLAVILGSRVPRDQLELLVHAWRGDGFWFYDNDDITDPQDCLDIRLVLTPPAVATLTPTLRGLGFTVDPAAPDDSDRGKAIELHRCAKTASVLSGG